MAAGRLDCFDTVYPSVCCEEEKKFRLWWLFMEFGE